MFASDNSSTVSSNFDNSRFTNPSTPLDVSLPLQIKSSLGLREEFLAQPLGASPSSNPNPLFSKTWWVHPDSNGDGKTDFFWHNTQTGENRLWLMDGATISKESDLFRTDSDWSYQVGDVDGDGKKDLVWRNFTTGENAVWLLNNYEIKASAFLTKVDDLSWSFKLGDTNGDGKQDLIWRNYKTGENAIWQMNGLNYQQAEFITKVDDIKWDFKVGDTNGDGKADLIWRNSQSGENAVWIMDGFTLQKADFLFKVEDLNWKFKIADTNGDGKTDLVWRNYKTGENAVWFFKDDGLEYDYGAFLDKVDDLNWDFSIADTNGDGKTDLVWRNYQTGENAVWRISAARVSGSNLGEGKIDDAKFIQSITDLNWDFNIGDYNGDGKSDLFWRNFQTGENKLWFLNDLQLSSEATISSLEKGWVFF
ncbi:VCBS repeat-containing protein [Calothrix sp. UHCC 0171]|uniref:FG-GAP repeat domain-containing protein n=1 Tax=Calothrix sp. UHCC 0171 TaxID=3110245 RepID=UPI002B1F27F7|nr:VCBS repeat-containing protein [Calothrix sp. UHCC 0171]MEA5572733.1 VCBS repeat-containing protein [Calothrix sp. UHCC 0171]